LRRAYRALMNAARKKELSFSSRPGERQANAGTTVKKSGA
jgi:hypothetical protein